MIGIGICALLWTVCKSKPYYTKASRNDLDFRRDNDRPVVYDPSLRHRGNSRRGSVELIDYNNPQPRYSSLNYLPGRFGKPLSKDDSDLYCQCDEPKVSSK